MSGNQMIQLPMGDLWTAPEVEIVPNEVDGSPELRLVSERPDTLVGPPGLGVRKASDNSNEVAAILTAEVSRLTALVADPSHAAKVLNDAK